MTSHSSNIDDDLDRFRDGRNAGLTSMTGATSTFIWLTVGESSCIAAKASWDIEGVEAGVEIELGKLEIEDCGVSVIEGDRGGVKVVGVSASGIGGSDGAAPKELLR